MRRTISRSATYSGTICSFSRFLADNAGPTTALNLTDGPPKINFKEQDVSLYFGDDWRIKENLTLNLGIRWDYNTQPMNLLRDQSIQNQQGSSPFWDPTLPSSVTTVSSPPNKYNYFGPNIGFAWTPGIGKGKTVIRGGYRLTYDPAYYNIFLNVATAAPVVNAGSISVAACTAPCLPTSGFLGSDVRGAHLGDIPRGVNPGARNNTRVTNDFHNPHTNMWSFGVQQEMTRNVAIEVRYVGNHNVGNFQTINGNPALDGLVANSFTSFIPSGVTPCSTAGTPGFATQRANCDFTNVRVRGNTSYSIYNGLQSQLRINNWHGLSAAASYTWSKTVDNASEIFSTFSGGATVAGAQDPFDVSNAERGLSGQDFPQLASIYLVYDLPFYRSQQGVLGHVLGGFQINTTWRYSSGQLWTPGEFAGESSSCQNGFDAAFFSGVSTCRPFYGNPKAPVDKVGLCTDPTKPDCGLVDYFAVSFLGVDPANAGISPSAVRWIFNEDNAAQFFGTPYGNVPRNPGVRGDAVNTVNFSVFKNTKITERVSFRFEAQAVNVLNHMFRGAEAIIRTPRPQVSSAVGSRSAGRSSSRIANLSNGGRPAGRSFCPRKIRQ